MKKETIKRIKKIVDALNSKGQIIKSIEELSELSKELCKYLIADSQKGEGVYTNKATSKAKMNITEEMADVFIMLQQLLLIFENEKEVQEMIDKKIERTFKTYYLK